MMFFYKVLTYSMYPFIKLWFYLRCLTGKDRLHNVKNHFGVATIKRPKGKFIWIHAASIGESLSAVTYINHLKKVYPDINILITTITVTSADILSKRLNSIKNCYHQYVVADALPWIRKFLDYWDVSAAVFLESEVWPNIIEELDERKIPVYLLNARLSKKSFERWRLLKKTAVGIFSKYTKILAQSELDKERFSFFSEFNVVKIDNLKYANATLPVDENLREMFTKIFFRKKVFVAASTHASEEAIIFEAFKKIRADFDTALVLIPRHLDRVSELKEYFKNEKFFLRSEVHSDDLENFKVADICIVDTFGEVGTFFKLADLCFVGGSLVPIGGHNIYEPIALSKTVMFGPYMDNALEVRDLLIAKGVGFEVKNASSIAALSLRLLSAPEEMTELFKKAESLSKNKSLEQIDRFIKL